MKQKMQISYEENYEIIIKLNNYILPFALIGIFLIGTFFHTDILLALVVVSLILSLYLGLTIQDYQIVIIKSKGVIHVRN